MGQILDPKSGFKGCSVAHLHFPWLHSSSSSQRYKERTLHFCYIQPVARTRRLRHGCVTNAIKQNGCISMHIKPSACNAEGSVSVTWTYNAKIRELGGCRRGLRKSSCRGQRLNRHGLHKIRRENKRKMGSEKPKWKEEGRVWD